MTHLEPYPVTPKLTHHARERCEQMGITTKVAKRIWQRRSVTRSMHDQDEQRLLVTSTAHPDYSLVVDTSAEVPVVITVLFECPDVYVREGTSYRVVG